MTQNRVADTLAFMQSVTAHSYTSNKDADGVMFSSGSIIRQNPKINFANYQDELKNSRFIMSHQRFATSGLEEDIHPFNFGELVMAHNGVMAVYEGGQRSDSYNFFKLLNDHFEQKLEEGLDRQDAITWAIKKELDGKAAGSYSISIFDTVDKCMYYFKNSQRVIKVYRSEHYLFMTTNASNHLFLGFLGEDFEEIDLKAHTIYKVTAEGVPLDFVEVSPIAVYVYSPPQNTKHNQSWQQNHGYAQQQMTKSLWGKEQDDDEIDDLAEYYGDLKKDTRNPKASKVNRLDDNLYKDDSEHSTFHYPGYSKVRKAKECHCCRTLTHFREEGNGKPICEFCIVEEYMDEEQ